jgi:hypothetical protein
MNNPWSGSYVDADGTDGSATALTSDTTFPILLSGAGVPAVFGFACLPVLNLTCSTQAALATDYRSWGINGKVATDYEKGALALTPSITVFGGNSRNDQDFDQSFTQRNLAGVVQNTGVYAAATKLDWDDVGAKVGLNAKFALTNWLALQAGGDIGFAYRQALFSGRDVVATSAGAVLSGASVVSDEASETAFIANAEAGAVLTPLSGVSIRGFVGLTWDSEVPGFSGPSFTGPIGAPTTVTPAAIRFEDEVSYYAGGRIAVEF